jgi:hypothetical protein
VMIVEIERHLERLAVRAYIFCIHSVDGTTGYHTDGSIELSSVRASSFDDFAGLHIESDGRREWEICRLGP